ncbi:50S ribosomal protein L29 [Candidatus Woesearchaeota archaeon]|nr:50S ribosomal protein L29 [Candidatus Woesearchaeota archaeon]
MKVKEIRGMDKNMAAEKMAELKKELVKINAQVAIGTAMKNPGQIRKIKKTLARIITIEHEKKSRKDEKTLQPKKKEVGKKA